MTKPTAQELRAQLRAKIEAMPLGALEASIDDLWARENRDEAENLVAVQLSTEYMSRIRKMAAEFDNEALLRDYQMLSGEDYSKMPKTRRCLHDVIESMIEQRFPAAAEAVYEWLDTIDPNTEPDSSYSDKLLGLVRGMGA